MIGDMFRKYKVPRRVGYRHVGRRYACWAVHLLLHETDDKTFKLVNPFMHSPCGPRKGVFLGVGGVDTGSSKPSSGTCATWTPAVASHPMEKFVSHPTREEEAM